MGKRRMEGQKNLGKGELLHLAQGEKENKVDCVVFIKWKKTFQGVKERNLLLSQKYIVNLYTWTTSNHDLMVEGMPFLVGSQFGKTTHCQILVWENVLFVGILR